MQKNTLDNYPLIKDKFEKCEDEPLHLIGKVQAYGFIIVLNTYSFKIEQVSENINEFLNLKPKELLNQKIFNIIKANNQKNFTVWLHNLYQEHSPFTLLFNKKLYNITAVRTESYILLECEPFKVRDNIRQTNLIAYTSHFLDLIEESKSIDELLQISVDQLRTFFEYDRVLIMRFEKEWNGYVVAESKKLGVPPFLNHHFPPSDIPEQARKMLLETPMRYINDTNSESIPLIPYIHPELNRPTDLLTVGLRNPSEFHLQYLRNMGVKSTITTSIIIKNKLWGIITAHNFEKKTVSFEKRQLFNLLTKYFSQQLLIKQQNQTQTLFNIYKQSVDILTEQMHGTYSVVNGLIKGRYTLLDLVESNSGGLFYENKLYLIGNSPNKELVLNIIDWFKNSSYGLTFSTNCLSKFLPESEKHKEKISGLLIVKLSFNVDNYFFWFREEIQKEITWAGNPHKNMDKGLTPRSTFESWIEKAQGYSKDWVDAEINAVKKLASNCIEVEFISNKLNRHNNEQANISISEHEALIQELGKVKEDLSRVQNFQSKLVKQIDNEETKELLTKVNSKVETASLLIDPEFTILLANAHSRAYFNKRQRRLIRKGENVLQFLSEIEKEDFITKFNRALQGESVSEERRTESYDSEIWFEESFNPSYNKEGEIWAIAYNLTDISKKKVEQYTLENLALIAKNTLSGVLLCDKYGKIEWVNDAFCKLSEYSKNELISKYPKDILRGPETEELKSKRIDNYINNYQSFKEEIVNYTKSGKKIWLKIEAHTYKDNYGRDKYFTINTNITAEKEAERQLKVSNEKYSLLSENSHDVVCLLNPKGELRYITPSIEELLGYTQDELIHKGLSTIIHPSYKHEIYNIFKGAARGKIYSKVEYKLIKKDTSIIWILSNLKPIFNRNGKVLNVLSSSRDITEQKEQDAKIADLNQKLTFAMEISKVAWWEWNISTEIISYSKTLLGFTGWSKEYIGKKIKTFFELIHKTDKIRLLKRITEAKKTNQYYFEENFRLLCSNQSYKWMSSKILIVQNNATNQPILLKGVLMDVNEWKQSQKKLKKKNRELKKINKELDRFVYSVSHDLRAPLASVMGLINVMSDINENESLNEYFGMQLRSLKKLDNFIHDILDFSKNNRLKLEPKKVYLRSLIESQLEQLDYFSQKNKIKILLLIDENFHFVTDEVRLTIVIKNLLSNAIRFSAIQKDDPYIKINAEKREDSIFIKFEDNGIGIETKYLENVYKIFFRATSQNNGPGLGLYIVKETLNKMHGDITIFSEYGVGTEVSFTVPDLLSKYEVQA